MQPDARKLGFRKPIAVARAGLVISAFRHCGFLAAIVAYRQSQLYLEVIFKILFIYVIIADGRRQIIKIVHKGDFFGYAVGVPIFVPE